MKGTLVYSLFGILGFTVGLIAAFMGIMKLFYSLGFYPHAVSDFGIVIYAILLSALPILFGALVARTITRWYSKRVGISLPVIPGRKFFILALAALYALTWAAGVPAVQSLNTKWAVEEYKRLKARGDPRVWETHPRIRTFLAFPILPFVIVSYHEYLLSGLYGWGGWDIHFWYGKGAKRIFIISIWVS